MRVLGAVVLAAMLGACTSVKMVQRDGCWVKRTEKAFGRVREEIGPCKRAPPKWVEDQLTRLVQECVAQADWRWQARALEAWSRAKPYPPQPTQEETLRTCMQEARVGLVSENDELKRRLTDVVADRDTQRTAAEQERARFQRTLDRSLDRLQDSHDRIAGYLGEAAQKPAGTATATATSASTSDGKATNESGATLSSGSTSDSGASAPPTVTASAPVTPAPAPPRAVSAAPALGEKAAARPAGAGRAAKPAALRPGAERGCEFPGVQAEAHAARPAGETPQPRPPQRHGSEQEPDAHP